MNSYRLDVWTLVVLTTLFNIISGASFDPELICTLVVSGTKLNDPRACNAWIQCINEQPVSGTCEEGLFYDRETENCVSSEDIKCISSNPCSAKTEGFAADPYSCNGYYYCVNGSGTRGECNNGLNFNPGTEDCIRNFPCQQKMDPDNLCNILPDGVFIKDVTNCNGWQMCWQGEVINGTCPGTFYYSAEQAKCDYPENVDCGITVPPLIAEAGECPYAGAFISDKSTCNGYYYCHETSNGEMQLEHGECADSRFFYALNGGSCIQRSQAQCSYDRCIGLGASTIQLANESDDGCTGYSICQDGVSIGVGECPSGQYFDELNQRCTTQHISYPACALSTETTTWVDEQTIGKDNTDTTTILDSVS